MTADLVLDLLLVVSLLLLAWLLLRSEDFLRTAVLFIAFGLFMAIAWVRLLAPDIALAEAAIGAGITGVLLMDAIRHMEWERQQRGEDGPEHPPPKRPLAVRGGILAAALAAGGLLVAGVWQLPGQRPGLAGAVSDRTEELEHPVTAVLVVFRSIDTWLELGILMLAVIGLLAARGRQTLEAASLAPPRDPVLEGVVRVLAPLAILVAGYLLWLGTWAPGGAFQSGVILGAVGMLLWLSDHRSIEALPVWGWKLLIVVGFATFTAAAAITLLLSGAMLEYPPDWMLAMIKSIELAAAISIGACFTALFVGQHPAQQRLQTDDGKQERHPRL
jgi:multisubunit Na+/H+ antiporter MnhB subunit